MRSAVLRSIPLVIAITVVPVAARAQATGADSAQSVAPAVPSPTAAVPIPPATAEPAAVVPAAAPVESAAAATVPADSAASAPSTESAAADAGGWRGLAAGDTVRLVSAAGRYAGTIARVTADTVVISGRGRSDAVVRSDVTEMYRLTGRGSRGKAMLRGGGLGLVGGAALGLLAGATFGRVDCQPSDSDCSPGRDKTIPVALTADGAILGALLGIMTGPIFRRPSWERVDAAPAPAAALPPVTVTPVPGGGVSLGATLRL